MNASNYTGAILLIAILAVSTGNMQAQQAEKDGFKLKLKQSLRDNLHELNPELKYQRIEPKPLKEEVLKVSPSTKLPTKFDRIETLNPSPPEERVHLNLNVTNLPNDQVSKSSYDYSRGGVIPIPDPHSKSQWTQYSSGSGITKGFDADPVRAIQNIKARKRKEKIDRIKKAYEQK